MKLLLAFSQLSNRARCLTAVAVITLSPASLACAQEGLSAPFVVVERSFAYTSDWSAVEEPLITEAMANVTVTASERLAESERLRMVVEVEGGPDVILVDLTTGDSWDSVAPILRSGLGALAQSSVNTTRIRFVIDAVSASATTSITVSDLRTEETGRNPEQALRETSLVSFEFFASMIDPVSGESTYTREFGDLSSQESITLNVRYHGLVSAVDPATLGDDDLCIGEAELLGFSPSITLVSASQGEGLQTNATYELLRPAGGWELYERQGALALSVCLGGVRSESGNRQTVQLGELTFGPPAWQDVLPTVWDPELPLRERRTGPFYLDGLDQPFIDIPFRVNASRIPVGQLGSGDLILTVGFEVYPADLLATGEVEDGLYEVNYRFDRPPGGWPFSGLSVALSPDFRSLRTRQQPGAVLSNQLEVITSIQLPEGARHTIIASMSHGEADALSADTFELSVDFVSENGVNVGTIGDGDLRLLHERRPLPSGQDGRLLRTEVKEEGRRVTAVYEFQRDPNAVFSGTWIKPYSPRGAVKDLADNATPGGLADEWEFNGTQVLSTFNVIRQTEGIPEGEFDYGFIPLSPYHPILSEYHFRVVYSSRVPIDLEDFVAHPHLAGETQPLGQDAQDRLPDLHPELRNWRSADGGRLVEADYVIERPEWGWPQSVVLTLIQQGIRDIEKRVPPVPENSPTLGIAIADLGGNTDEAIRATVLAGQEVSAEAESHRIAILLEANERLESNDFADSLVWFGWHPELLPGIEDFDLPFPTEGRLVDFFNVDDEDIENYELRVFFNRPVEELPQSGEGQYDVWITNDTIRLRAFAQDGRVLIDREEELSDIKRFLYAESKISGREKVRDLPDNPRQTLVNIARQGGGLKGGVGVATYEVGRPAEGWEAWDLGRVPFVLQVPADEYRLTRIAGSDPFVGFVSILNSPTALPLLQGFEDWLRDLEEKSDLPSGSLADDHDEDGQDELIEYVLGSDPTDSAKHAQLQPEVTNEEGERFLTLIVPLRQTAADVTLEIQQSSDGKTWRSIRDEFELIERRSGEAPEVEHLVLRRRIPLSKGEKLDLFRVHVVR